MARRTKGLATPKAARRRERKRKASSQKKPVVRKDIITPRSDMGEGEEKGEDDDEEEDDDGIPFADKMNALTTTLGEQLEESARLEEQIKKNLAGLGYEV